MVRLHSVQYTWFTFCCAVYRWCICTWCNQFTHAGEAIRCNPRGASIRDGIHVVQTMLLSLWCNLCDAVYVMQSMWNTLCGAIYVVHVTWRALYGAFVRGAIYEVRYWLHFIWCARTAINCTPQLSTACNKSCNKSWQDKARQQLRCFVLHHAALHRTALLYITFHCLTVLRISFRWFDSH